MSDHPKKNLKILPFNFVIFGGDGDLAFRKIYPALFHRFVDKQIGTEFSIFCITRSDGMENDIRKSIGDFISKSIDYPIDKSKQKEFIQKIQIVTIKSPDVGDYRELNDLILENAERQRIFYLSTPSSAFGEISTTLKKAGLIMPNSKVILEKPLGYDLRSSNDIQSQISKSFAEPQIYRIDHYLGKETVQNLMVLRFANHLFEHSWSSEHIESVHITVAESLGVGRRGGYYDKSGALLDMVQNHLLQLLCLIAMEPPTKLEAESVRNEKLKVLNSLRVMTKENVEECTVKGQYTRGKIKDESVQSYLEDIENFESNTETFVAIKAFIDNWRWKGTPFYMRTGKRMTKRYSEIVINFKSVRHNVFNNDEEIPGNKLIIRLQPQERIELVQMTKLPGPGGYRYKPISLKLDYVDSFHERFPEAYERLIIDILRGEQTLFMHKEELEAAWEWIESITNSWKETKMKNILYEAGSRGPGDEIMEKNHEWSKSNKNDSETV